MHRLKTILQATCLASAVLTAVMSAFAAEPASTDEAAREVADGSNEFAFDLYEQLRLHAAPDANIAVSPYSVSSALAMTYAGARGQTATEMAKTLHFSLPQERLHPACAALQKSLTTVPAGDETRLRIANRLWGRHGAEFLPAFLAVTREQYGAELSQLDFQAAPDESRQTINDWVANRTADKIKDLLPPRSIDAQTELVLTNAIHFLDQWQERFNIERTKDAPFAIAADKQVTVPLMHQRERHHYAETDSEQIVELSYREPRFAMLLVLPKAGKDLATLEESLRAKDLQTWEAELCEREVDAYLPRFKVSSRFEFSDVLSSLGMGQAFSDNADFSGMNGQQNLRISAVFHQALVDVNEQGTEAGAATSVVVKRKATPVPPVVFRADHPFLFLLRDNPTGTILFLGRVANPLAGASE